MGKQAASNWTMTWQCLRGTLLGAAIGIIPARSGLKEVAVFAPLRSRIEAGRATIRRIRAGKHERGRGEYYLLENER